MSTCASCYFWRAENPNDAQANCSVDPPKVIPIMSMQAGKPTTILQNVYPTTTRDDYCRHHDARPRPVIKLATALPPDHNRA